jgi:hypothetical protein
MGEPMKSDAQSYSPTMRRRCSSDLTFHTFGQSASPASLMAGRFMYSQRTAYGSSSRARRVSSQRRPTRSSSCQRAMLMITCGGCSGLRRVRAVEVNHSWILARMVGDSASSRFLIGSSTIMRLKPRPVSCPPTPVKYMPPPCGVDHADALPDHATPGARGEALALAALLEAKSAA